MFFLEFYYCEIENSCFFIIGLAKVSKPCAYVSLDAMRNQSFRGSGLNHKLLCLSE